MAATLQPPASEASQAAPASGSPPVDFSTALSVWRDINLADLQSSLVAIAPSLLEAQKVSLVNRKKLAEQTREFKKQPDDAKLEAIKPLLKAYQSEIDTLTKRSKSAENAFLNVHSALSTAPDPYPFMEVVLEQAASLTDLEAAKNENEQLKQEVAKLKANSASRSEDEAEKKRLQERVNQLESGYEERIQERTSSVERELSAKWDERVLNLNEREKDLTKSLNLAHEQLRELKSKDETATARLLQKGQEEEDRETKGKLAEIELLTRDLERAQSRVEAVERRNEQLRAEIESVKSGHEESEKVKRLEAETLDKDAKISHLQALIENDREQLDVTAKKISKVEEEKARIQKDKEAEIESLKSKLSRCSDYEEIKRELEIVKMVEFNEYEDEEVQGEAEGKQKWTGAGAKPLEALLLEKNKKLQDQLTSLRVEHEELADNSKTSTTELDKLKKEIARIKTLNERLENDLVSIGANGGRSGPTGSSGMSAEEALEELERLGSGAAASSKDKSIPKLNGKSSLETTSEGQTPTRLSTSTNGPGAGAADTSILPIITSQRDRFRSRNAELEEELRKQFETITELRAEVKTLQADNLGLYEKLRYLQSYGSRAAGDSVVDIGAYPPPPPRHDDDDKYRAKYEESMNPFEAFRGRVSQPSPALLFGTYSPNLSVHLHQQEQSRAIAALNPLERLLHMATRLVLGHRRMRLLFTAYAIFLHFMVFGMLFEVGHRYVVDQFHHPIVSHGC